MDHNGVLTADDHVDSIQRTRAGNVRDGGYLMLAAEGGIDKRIRDEDEESEETPLLADRDTNTQENGDQPRRESEYRPWDEFAHLPWWKKPHVRFLTLATYIWICITLYRPTGY
jgi:hypothetical protein